MLQLFDCCCVFSSFEECSDFRKENNFSQNEMHKDASPSKRKEMTSSSIRIHIEAPTDIVHSDLWIQLK